MSNPALTVELVYSLLDRLMEPKLKWSLTALNLVRSVEVDGDTVRLTINLVTQDVSETDGFRSGLEQALKQLGFASVDLTLGHVDIATEGVSGIKHIVLVGSGKGGVGKSSIAVNLACGLAQSGLSVGIMDADIHGPSLPILLGLTGQKPQVLADDYLLPLDAHGVKAMSVGMLVPEGQAVEWRGPMAAGTLIQFIQKTLWGELDVLVIDLPPGTGDLHLTLADKIKATGTVVVTTPQEVVLGDVRRSLDQWQRHSIEILGVVENMSYLICEHCGGANRPFSGDGAAKEGLPELARLPLDRRLSEAGDKGIPAVLSPTEDALSRALDELVTAVRLRLPPA